MRDTGIEPVTSSVSGKRSPAELIARVDQWRWRRESNPCARLCRPLPHHSATPPLGFDAWCTFRADDGIRTRDPHLGKVMRYQLRYIREPRARSSPVANTDNSPPTRTRTNPGVLCRGDRIQRKRPPVLIFDLGKWPPWGVPAGPVAQWESVRFTRGRSLVRSQPGPPQNRC